MSYFVHHGERAHAPSCARGRIKIAALGGATRRQPPRRLALAAVALRLQGALGRQREGGAERTERSTYAALADHRRGRGVALSYIFLVQKLVRIVTEY